MCARSPEMRENCCKAANFFMGTSRLERDSEPDTSQRNAFRDAKAGQGRSERKAGGFPAEDHEKAVGIC